MLYFVATPIGNLKDITLRALETLKSVDVIACEDTRKSSILLRHYDIHKKLIAYHKNNEAASAKGILELLEQGKNVAVVSDSGMPVISDPGCVLIDMLNSQNLPYTIIPGANAGLSALVLSGFDATKFAFLGFLQGNQKQKTAVLESYKNLDSTLIIYVAPHDVLKELDFVFGVLGKRRACLVKEISKMFETKCFFTLGEVPNIETKGEFVLLVEGQKTEINPLADLPILEQVDFYVQLGKTKKEALKIVAKANKIKNIYSILK